MPELTNDMTRDDVRQWLEGGFYLVRTRSGEKVCYLAGFPDYGVIESEDLDGNYHVTSQEECIGYWPECGSLNITDKVAVYLARRPRRQWRRTYNERCLELSIPRRWEAMKMEPELPTRLRPSSHMVVRAAFSPSYVSLGAAVRAIRAGAAISRAINPHIIIAGDAETLLVYYRGELAARIEDGQLVGAGATDKTLNRMRKLMGGAIL